MGSGFRIPVADLSAVLQPLVFDGFVDPNGTSLDAHTPDVDDVGGGWTERAGDWDIQANRCDPSRVANQVDRATVDAGVSDPLVRTSLHFGQCADISKLGILLRYSDESNHWFSWVEALPGAGDVTRIYEVNGGVTTLRVSLGVILTINTTYDHVVVADGQTITTFVDGADRITFSPAVHNETETVVGLRSKQEGAITNPNWVDNFHVHALRAAVYDTTLDEY